jgi:DNA-binding GntR family transcriptional regulator
MHQEGAAMGDDTGKLSDRLRETLEEEIVTGALKPGDRLEEIALAERFGVSRTPIREALLQLSAAGLIANRPRRGAVVAEIGPRRLVEMFAVMAELEGMCARLAARRAGPEEVATIRGAHEACRRAAETHDVDAYYRLNEIFHVKIRQAARNGFLFDECDGLQRRLRPYRRLQLRARGRIARSFEEHEAIVAAIESGDGEGAASAMRAHVEVQGERFADLVSSLEDVALRRA